MNRACLSIGLAACCLLAGCSTQSVRAPAYNIKPGNVCVIQDSSNRKVAYNSVIKGLKRKGFSVKRVGAGQTKNCSRVFSCQSISRWQIANYTSNIHLQYWEHGKLVSEAKYDAPTNEINISKFISTEDKIFQLLNEMLPGTRTLRQPNIETTTLWTAALPKFWSAPSARGLFILISRSLKCSAPSARSASRLTEKSR